MWNKTVFLRLVGKRPQSFRAMNPFHEERSLKINQEKKAWANSQRRIQEVVLNHVSPPQQGP